MKNTRIVFVVLCAAAMLGSCVGTPTGDFSGDVSIVYVPATELSHTYGAWDQNPFMPPSGLLSGQPDDFIVLRLSLTTDQPTTVAVDAAVAMTPEGSVSAQLHRANDLRDYWAIRSKDDRSTDRLMTKIMRFCPQSGSMVVVRSVTYLLVLIGKNPIPRPARIITDLSLNGTPRRLELVVE